MRYVIGLLMAAALALGAFALYRLATGGQGGDADIAANAAPPPLPAGVAPAASGDVPPASYAELLRVPFRTEDGAELDVDAAMALAPSGWTADYDAAAFIEESGGTRIEGLKIASDAIEGLAVEADAVTLWNFDTTALSTRLSGRSLDAPQPLARRIDARGVRVVGLDALYKDLIDPVSAAAERAAEDAGDDINLSVSLDDYTLEAGRIVLDNVELHPWTLALVEEDRLATQDAETRAALLDALHIGQKWAAAARAYSIDAVAFENLVADFSMSQFGETSSTRAVIESGGYEGLERGDLASGEVRGMTVEGASLMPDFARLDETDLDSDQPPMRSMAVSGSVARYAARDIRLASALDHLARGVLPDPETADLMSLGVLTIEDLDYAFDGHEIYSIGEMTLNASGFAWLAPTQLEISATDVSYDLRGIRDVVVGLVPPGDDKDKGVEIADNIIGILGEYGLDRPSLDGALSWTWDATGDGAAKGAFAYAVKDMTRMELEGSGALPVHADWAPLAGWSQEEMDEDALAALFEADSAFTGGFFRLTDEGGLQTTFELAPRLAGAIPEDTPQLQAFAAYEPDTLRTMAVAGVQMASSQLGRETPELRPVFDELAAWLQEGGVYEIRLAPPAPVTPALIQALDETDPEPREAFETLGLSVVHTPPPGADEDAAEGDDAE